MNTASVSPIISIEHIRKAYGDNVIFSDYSLALPSGSRTALLGASGIGKTTLLRLILGLAPLDEGRILADSEVRFSAVFQEDRLFEDAFILDNLDVLPGPFNRELAKSILTGLFLNEEDICSKRISGCSGGMKRRTAIGRALYACRLYAGKSPVVLLMDEPFKGLDSGLKKQVISYVDCTLLETGATLLLVTHEKEEAAALGCSLVSL